MEPERLGTGTADETTFLRGDQTYAVPEAGGGGVGDVIGPASATDNALARYDSTTGKLLQDGAVTESDAGTLAGITQLNVDNLRLDENTVSSTNTNGDVFLTPNGAGVVRVPQGESKLAFGTGGASMGDYNSDGRIGFNAGGVRRGDMVDLGGVWAFRFGARMLTDATIDDCNGITVNGCRFLGFKSSAGAPTTAELPNNKDLAVHKNTSSGVVSLAFNDSGAVKVVTLA
jgi:hypothetical protein